MNLLLWRCEPRSPRRLRSTLPLLPIPEEACEAKRRASLDVKRTSLLRTATSESGPKADMEETLSHLFLDGGIAPFGNLI